MQVLLLRHDARLPAKDPEREHEDAGYDLFVAGDYTLEPGESKDIHSGIAIAPDRDGIWYRIVSRSSTHRRRRLHVREGTIDAGFRGELFTYVTNESDRPVTIRHGERLAQIIPMPLIVDTPREVKELPDSHRGRDGFGSTGGYLVEDRVETIDRVSIGAREPEWQAFPQVTGTPEIAVTQAWRVSQPIPSRLVYLGGPVDHRFASGPLLDRESRHHSLAVEIGNGWSIYDPICARISGEEEGATIERNMGMLRAADAAIFEYATDQPSFGTPIEIWYKAVEWDQPRAVIIKTGVFRGLVSDYLLSLGVRLAGSWAQAVKMLND